MSYWGKLGHGHKEIILELVRALPEKLVSTILMPGCGDPHAVDVADLAWKIYDTTRKDILLPRDGRGKVFTKTVHFLFSDNGEWRVNLQQLTRLRSRQVDAKNRRSGFQLYARLDVCNLGLRDESIDMVIALGLFTSRALTAWEAALTELSRVAKPKALGCVTVPCRDGFADVFERELQRRSLRVERRVDAADQAPDPGDHEMGSPMRALFVFECDPQEQHGPQFKVRTDDANTANGEPFTTVTTCRGVRVCSVRSNFLPRLRDDCFFTGCQAAAGTP